MPVFEITDPQTGQVIEIEGASPPSEQELEQIFASVRPQTAPASPAAPSEAPFTPFGAVPAGAAPPGAQMPILPTPGQIAAVPGQIAEAVTGAARATPETRTLPEIGAISLPEGEAQIAAGLLASANIEDQKSVIQDAVPGVKFEEDAKGNTIVDFGEGKRAILNKPGLSPQDLLQTTAQVLSFIPAGRITAMAGNLAKRVGLGAAAAGGTQAGLQVAERALGAPEAIRPAEIATTAALGGIVFPARAGQRALAPVSGVGEKIAQKSSTLVETAAAKKLLKESAPTIEGLKTAARGVYNELDTLGATINPASISRLSKGLQGLARKEGFSPISGHANIKATLAEFDAVAGKNLPTSELDRLRKVASNAASSADSTEARIGSLMVGKIDDFLDNLNKQNFTKFNKDIGAKYRDARQLWRRAKKAEQIEEAIERASLSASAPEKAIVQEFRTLLKSKKKKRGFTREELAAMESIVKGGPLQNMAIKLGMFGVDTKRAAGILMPFAGLAAGVGATAGPGAIAIPAIGTLSKQLAQKLTRDKAVGADLVVRAGNKGLDVVKAYMRITKPEERSAKELAELLLRPNMNLNGVKEVAKRLTKKQGSIVSDAAFLVGALKAAEGDQEP